MRSGSPVLEASAPWASGPLRIRVVCLLPNVHFAPWILCMRSHHARNRHLVRPFYAFSVIRPVPLTFANPYIYLCLQLFHGNQVANLVDHTSNLGSINKQDRPVHFQEPHPTKDLSLFFRPSYVAPNQCYFQFRSHETYLFKILPTFQEDLPTKFGNQSWFLKSGKTFNSSFHKVMGIM